MAWTNDISKANKNFDVLIHDLRFEALRRIKTVWFPVAQSGAHVHGLHPCLNLGVLSSAYTQVVLPYTISEVKEVTLRFIPTTTGTIDWTVNISSGVVDDDESTATATKTEDGLSVTDDAITEIDITSIFGTQKATEQIGVEFVLDAAATTTDVYVLGVFLKYV